MPINQPSPPPSEVPPTTVSDSPTPFHVGYLEIATEMPKPVPTKEEIGDADPKLQKQSEEPPSDDVKTPPEPTVQAEKPLDGTTGAATVAYNSDNPIDFKGSPLDNIQKSCAVLINDIEALEKAHEYANTNYQQKVQHIKDAILCVHAAFIDAMKATRC
jgi:hypothetical protein